MPAKRGAGRRQPTAGVRVLDRWALPALSPALSTAARALRRLGVGADWVTAAGFAVGLAALPALAWQRYELALLCILLNRLCDGIDGALARLAGPSDAGAYLDIVLDFIFYAAVVCGFAWADPAANALAAATLLFAFFGTGASFLAYAVLAEKRGRRRLHYPSKGFYYLQGLTEGTETIAFLVLFCVLPAYFAPLAYLFAALCGVTAVTRVVGGYRALRAA